jgi:CRISPR/Cas system CSM-associated protein Csm2 small subunit
MIDIKSIETLSIGPNEALVITVPNVSQSQMRKIYDTTREKLPGVTVIVAVEGIKFFKISKVEACAAVLAGEAFQDDSR